MTWLDPLSFLWLAAVVPPLVLLYFLRLRRRDVVMPSTLLWGRSVRDLRANAPFQRLRRNLLLAMQLLLLLLLAAALARPAVVGRSLPGRYKVLLIDQSASMACPDEDGRTRLEAALEAARGLMEGPDDAYFMVVGFGAQARTYCAFTDASMELRSALDRIEQLDTPTRAAEALQVARTALRGKTSGAILLLSDGNVSDGAAAEPARGEASPPVHYLPFGRSSENAGIVGLDVRRPLERGSPERTQVLVRLAGHGPGPCRRVLELRQGTRLLDAAELTLPPGGEEAYLFRLDAASEGAFSVELTPEDGLAADDRAHFVLRPPAPLRVALVSRGDFFLKGALEQNRDLEVRLLDPESCMRLEEGRRLLYPEELAEPPELLVLDGIAPDNALSVNALCLGCLPALPGLRAGGEAAEPLVIDWNRTHPITRYADFASLYIRTTRLFSLPGEARLLLEAREGPLAACIVRQGVRAVWTGFPVRESDWPLQVSFPVFLRNSLRWLAPASAQRGVVPFLQPGDPLVVPLSSGDALVRVTAPDGATGEAGRARGGVALFPDTEKVGLYAWTAGERSGRTPCNLLSPAETAVAPRPEVTLGRSSVEGGDASERTTREYWRWIVLAAVLLLAAEWYVYHRRSL